MKCAVQSVHANLLTRPIVRHRSNSGFRGWDVVREVGQCRPWKLIRAWKPRFSANFYQFGFVCEDRPSSRRSETALFTYLLCCRCVIRYALACYVLSSWAPLGRCKEVHLPPIPPPHSRILISKICNVLTLTLTRNIAIIRTCFNCRTPSVSALRCGIQHQQQSWFLYNWFALSAERTAFVHRRAVGYVKLCSVTRFMFTVYFTTCL